MRMGTAAGHRGYFHETACYGSDEEFLSIVVPFLEGALEAGEPAVVALGEANTRLVRAATADRPGLAFLDGEIQYARPASTIKTFREMLAEHVAHGARQIRVVGEVPHPGRGVPWEWWARYEAAVNHLYDEFPVWGLCPYDTRITPAEVLDDVVRTHPYLATADGRHLTNARFEDPTEFLARRPAAEGDPLEAAPPVVDLVDPTPVVARRAVSDVARATGLDRAEIQDLVLVVSEVVTNGICHGRAPVRLRTWTAPDRIVTTVTDQGHGPTSPFIGLLPTPDTSSAGLGLWLAHQLCSHVTLGRTDEGFTVRLVAGVPSVEI
ncbi:MAG: anti-sigma factor RsbA family regulatory protein [Pseudonocardiaceae bacterium]